MPELRAGDADRERTVARLRDACAEGRLTLEELSERLDSAYAARTVAELDELARDLPAAPASVPARARGGPSRWIVAVFSGAEKRGRWRVGERANALAVFGGAHVDLTQAVIETPELTLTCVAVFGGVSVHVPRGVDVDLDGFALFGGNSQRVKERAEHPDAPHVRVRAFSLFGGVDVAAKRR